MSKIIEIIKTFNVQLALKNIYTKVDEIIKKLNDNEPKYKVYTALLTQTEMDAPIPTVLENTIGNIIWARTGAGDYTGTLNNAFTQDKTFVLYKSVYNTGGTYISVVYRANQNYFQIQTRDNLGAGADDVLYETSIEIRVYN